MSIQKKQHFVPQFYMRNFSNKGTFSIINMKENIARYNIPIKGQCQMNNYYDVHNVKNWEERLSRLENGWAKTIRNIVGEKDNYILTEDDKEQLIIFATFQNSRSTRARDSFISMKWESLKVMHHMEKRNIINDNNEAVLRKHFEKLHNDAPSILLNIVEKGYKFLLDLNVKIIEYDTKDKLIASDNPIIYSNRIYPNVGAMMAGLLIFFPISSSQLVVLYDGKIYKNIGEYSVSTNNDEVRKLNSYQLVAANNLVFGLDNYTFSNVSKLMDSIYLKRKKYWESIFSLQKLGTDEQKIILYSEPFIRIKDVRSFSKFSDIGNKIHRISLPNRDWFPRSPYIDEKFQERLKMKLMMSSVPIEVITNNLELDKIQEFNDLVELYWDMK